MRTLSTDKRKKDKAKAPQIIAGLLFCNSLDFYSTNFASEKNITEDLIHLKLSTEMLLIKF
jgi:hypothetical protein